MIIGGMVLSLLASIFLLSESVNVVSFEQKQYNESKEDNNMPLKDGEVPIENESNSLKISEVFSVFVKTSFVHKSLMVCCLAGLMINFLTAFAWGILTKWLKTWGNKPNWSPLPSAEVAFIVFC